MVCTSTSETRSAIVFGPTSFIPFVILVGIGILWSVLIGGSLISTTTATRSTTMGVTSEIIIAFEGIITTITFTKMATASSPFSSRVFSIIINNSICFWNG
ncbi:hypothetical protein HanXRQr2_Chr13g0585961 [Helianthus annuus]|uniref:Uncharacterized protein n=1 Tax=Helianthus annuus TaxID=4232 RepID=A0A9K3EJP9_HELAN|nr:hypothetical protein HanXRQr2_Chr13g0585961 [Helianthus annuus]